MRASVVNGARMFLYLALDRLFPTSFTAKVFFIVAVGAHVPMIAAMIYMFGSPGGIDHPLAFGLVLLGATLLGAIATLGALQAVLRPVYRIGQAMHRFQTDRLRTPLPGGLGDEIGQMMHLTNHLVLGMNKPLWNAPEADTTDPLTGALNRRGFEQKMRAMPFKKGTLLYADLDHFKIINDTLGHDMGDRVLLQTADTLHETLRDNDILGRFGGEEFVIFLPGLPLAEGYLVAQRLRSAIRQHVHAPGRPVTISMGVAPLALADGLADALIKADRALFRAKANGRDRVEQAHDLSA